MRTILALCLLLASTTVVTASTVCAKRDTIINSLNKSYGEQLNSAGLDNSGNLVEIFASPKGTWTILATTPSGHSCVMAVGESWEANLNLPAI